MERILLHGGRIIDPATGIDLVGDLLIHSGSILAFEDHLNQRKDIRPEEVFDCQGKWVVPGFIDFHVHLRSPGQEYKEDWLSGSRAAAAGGFVKVVAMANTTPVIDSEGEYMKIILQKPEPVISVVQAVAVSKGQKGEELVDLAQLSAIEARIVSDDGRAIQNPKLLRKAMAACRIHNMIMLIHCQNDDFTVEDPRSEFTYIELCLNLAEETGCPIHIQHVSTARSVELIRQAKAGGVKVTCETCPHYFSLTEEDYKRIGPNAKMNPPLRTEADRLAVIAGLIDNTIDIITTDHAPHAPEEKALGLEKAPFGSIGLETALAVTLTALADKMTPLHLIAKLTSEPAKILGTEGFGSLKKFSPAQITVIDPQKKQIVDSKKFYSKSRNCPWDGNLLQGWPVMVIKDGKIVMENSKVLI